MAEPISILLPVYNEESGLRDATLTVHAFFKQRGYEPEIILVDDASTDRSYEIAQQLAQELSNIKVLRHETNRGPCSGLRTGHALASHEWLLLMPVDLCAPLEDVLSLWEERNHGDIVLGYVANKTSRTPARRLQSRIYTALINAVFSMGLRQVNYVALYRRRIFDEVALTSEGVALHAEVLVRAARLGYRIHQVPLRYQPRIHGQATGSSWRVIRKTLAEIVRLRWSL